MCSCSTTARVDSNFTNYFFSCPCQRCRAKKAKWDRDEPGGGPKKGPKKWPKKGPKGPGGRGPLTVTLRKFDVPYL